MADARSLLRQQRAARRIEHPHAFYSEAGKLTCSLCREGVKSESLWEGHIRSIGHRQRLVAHQKARGSGAAAGAAAGPAASDQGSTASNGGDNSGASRRPKPSTDTLSDEALLAQIIGGAGAGGAGQKRKHGDDEDVEMPDAVGEDEVSRKKRSRPGPDAPAATPTSSGADASTTTTTRDSSASAEASKRTPSVTSPPGLVRRISGTPSHGVELQIPSRPATPSASGTSATSTPKATSMGRSPLALQDGQMASIPAVTASKSAPRAAFATTSSTAAAPPSATSTTTATAAAAAAGTDEDADWAAFEAEVVNAAPPEAAPAGRPTTDVSSDAVISAKPMTAEEIASRAKEEEQEKRKAQADIEIEDEQEEATRALEAEFEEMEELEARVRKLKEKREAIRRGSVPVVTAVASSNAAATTMTAPEGNGTTMPETTKPINGAVVEDPKEEDEDDEDEDEDEEDDWAGFRFRA